MQLVAYMNGERVDASQMTHGPWRALPQRPGYKDLVLLECGLRARRVSRLGRQFFAHWPDVGCSVTHKSESEQHLMMKLALMERINASPGWRAEVEYADPSRKWIADVMAFDGIGRRVAFEVQLSAQNEDDYIDRSQRYFEAKVGPVWVVPKEPEWCVVKLPVIVTGFGKSNDLPTAPDDLMNRYEFQRMHLEEMSVGAAVDRVLSPSFRWPHGAPERQRQRYLAETEAARARAEKAAASAEAERLRTKREAEEKARLEAKEAEYFVRAALPAAAVSLVPTVSAGVSVWASMVRCRKEGHPVLIWRLTVPAVTKPMQERWRPRAENFLNVRRHVDSWCDAAGLAAAKGKLVRVKGRGKPMAFACSVCGDLILGRLVASLPAEKWSTIASVGEPHLRSDRVVQPRKSVSERQDEERRLSRQRRESRRPIEPETLPEDSPDFIGPERPFWISDARDDQEISERQAAKDNRTAHLRTVRDNPRYRISQNGFRFRCTDCGGMFEDGNEGIHAGGRCS